MANDLSADPLVSSMLPLSRRRPMDEAVGPQPPPSWRDGARAAPGRSLSELCEPLFLLICRINRAARLEMPSEIDLGHSAGRVRAEVLRMLHSAAAVAAQEGTGRGGFERVRRPLELFVDDLMSRRFGSADNAENAWLPLAEIGPGFFSLLDLALVETGAGAADRLMIFYTCLTLGFWGGGDPVRSIDTYLAKLTARLGAGIDADDAAPICPDAYRHTDRRPLSEPAGGTLMGPLLAVAILILAVLALNGTLYFLRVESLQRDLDTFRHAVQAAPPSPVAPPSNGQGGTP